MDTVIAIDNLTFAYQNGTPALHRLSLKVGRGETVVFIGANGAGKTTLFLYLLGLLGRLPKEATVLGQPLTSMKAVEAMRGQVWLVFQNPEDQLFCTTVFDDVAFGPINQGLGAEEVKSRVALATIYAMRPEIMFLDEPTSNLDPRAKREAVELLRAFPGTKLVATHDFELALEVADRVVLLHQGEVRANGRPLSILTDETLLKANGLEMPLVIRYFLSWQARQAG